MKKQKLITTLLISAFALIAMASCEKEKTITPDPDAINNPVIYNKNYFEYTSLGIRWYENEKNGMFIGVSGFNYAYPTDKQVSFWIDLINDNDSLRTRLNMNFTLNQAVEPGVYTTSSGNLNQFIANMWKVRQTSTSGLAGFNANKGDIITITIDSIYKQQRYVLLFGSIDGTLSLNNSEEKLIITNAKFGYKYR